MLLVTDISAPSTSKQILHQTSAQPTPSFTLQASPHRNSLSDLAPLPKAPPRVKSKNGRSKGKSAIYTDTPEKEELEAKKRKINEKKIPKMRNLDSKRKSVKTTIKNTYKTNTNNQNEEIEDVEDDNYCIVCFEDYKSSREDWLQCVDCRQWAHSSCAKNNAFFVCINCLSE